MLHFVIFPSDKTVNIIYVDTAKPSISSRLTLLASSCFRKRQTTKSLFSSIATHPDPASCVYPPRLHYRFNKFCRILLYVLWPCHIFRVVSAEQYSPTNCCRDFFERWHVTPSIQNREMIERGEFNVLSKQQVLPSQDSGCQGSNYMFSLNNFQILRFYAKLKSSQYTACKQYQLCSWSRTIIAHSTAICQNTTTTVPEPTVRPQL